MKPAGPRDAGLGREKGRLFFWVLDNSSHNGWHRQKQEWQSVLELDVYFLSEAGIRAISQEKKGERQMGWVGRIKEICNRETWGCSQASPRNE